VMPASESHGAAHVTGRLPRTARDVRRTVRCAGRRTVRCLATYRAMPGGLPCDAWRLPCDVPGRAGQPDVTVGCGSGSGSAGSVASQRTVKRLMRSATCSRVIFSVVLAGMTSTSGSVS